VEGAPNIVKHCGDWHRVERLLVRLSAETPRRESAATGDVPVAA
jgi:hypothetical protein